MTEKNPELNELRPRISVVGVGGAGGNAVANMIRSGIEGLDFIAVNTDAQALRDSPASKILQLGRNTTSGLGAGSHAEIGRAAAEESLPEIERMLEGAHMCFIAAGLGGGTGTGAAPIIARAARSQGILTVAVVTKPFAFEGTRRARAAELGLEALRDHVDTLIVIPNQNLFRLANPATTFKAAFDLADEILQQGVRGITDLMIMPGMINLDFADIRTIMAGMGKAVIGCGEASGEDRALRSAEQAIYNPLLDDALGGAKGLIISIQGGADMRLMEVDEVANYVKEMVDPEADIIWGSAFNADLEGRIRVSVVATGIDSAKPPLEAPIVIPRIEPARPRPIPEEEAAEDELLLTIECALTLDPPEDAAAFPIIDPFPVEAEPPAESAPAMPLREIRMGNLSLFERMATTARETARPIEVPPVPAPLPKLRRGLPEGRIAL